MFSSWFTKSPRSEPLPEVTTELALGALLVRMAKVDEVYHYAEISTLDRVLAARFDLNPVEAAKMRATCELLEKAAPDTAKFVALIRDNVDLKDRVALLSALQRIAEADGVERTEEMELIKELRLSLLPTHT